MSRRAVPGTSSARRRFELKKSWDEQSQARIEAQGSSLAGREMPIHNLGGGGQNQGQQIDRDRLPIQQPLGPGFRRGTNDFAATGRQPPNAGAPVGGAGGQQSSPVQAEPPPKEKVRPLTSIELPLGEVQKARQEHPMLMLVYSPNDSNIVMTIPIPS